LPKVELNPMSGPKFAPLTSLGVHVLPHVSLALPKVVHVSVVVVAPFVLLVPAVVWVFASTNTLTNVFHVPSEDLSFASTVIPSMVDPLGMEKPYPYESSVSALLAPFPVRVARVPSSAVTFPGLVQCSTLRLLLWPVVQRFGPAVLMG